MLLNLETTHLGPTNAFSFQNERPQKHSTRKLQVALPLTSHDCLQPPPPFPLPRPLPSTNKYTGSFGPSTAPHPVSPPSFLSLTTTKPRTHTPIRITGCADWAFGYSTRTDTYSGLFLVVAEAKKRSLVFAAESQPLAYLAAIRELRSAAGKANIDVYPDGLNTVMVQKD